ncbi:MAG TPA: tyrosine-type recombinase/integrase [Candidatus Avalokitesvara rifleensis]|uniref:tyrosine-type recombinase/integrase n=1 Tax=Candidatus Avalokitesvara rifleensis TaxID=3367620 RepID=UPI0040265056
MGVYKKGRKGHKDLWWIDYYHEGKRVRECVGTSKTLAERALSVRKAQVLQVRYNLKPKGGPLFREFAEAWLEEKESHLKGSTFTDYRSILSQYLIPTFGSRPIGKITEGDIERFINSLEGRSPQRVNNVLTPLKGILKTAHRRHVIDTNPGEFIKPLRVDKPDIMPLSMEDVRLFLEVVDPCFRDYFLVAFFSGLRPSEQIALKWDRVDVARNKILVTEARVRGVEDTPKTVESGRTIDMLPPVKDALESQAKLTFLKGPYVFLSREGSVLDVNNLRNRIWYPTLKKAKIKRRTMYQTRHTFATLMLSSGENPIWAAKMMGHTSTEMLFKRYSRYIPNLTHRDGSVFLEKFYGHGHLLDTKTENGGVNRSLQDDLSRENEEG